jgi:hypothetical protein
METNKKPVYKIKVEGVGVVLETRDKSLAMAEYNVRMILSDKRKVTALENDKIVSEYDPNEKM